MKINMKELKKVIDYINTENLNLLDEVLITNPTYDRMDILLVKKDSKKTTTIIVENNKETEQNVINVIKSETIEL